MRLINRMAAGVCFLASICSVRGADDSLRIGNTTITGSGQMESAEIMNGGIRLNDGSSYAVDHVWYAHTIGILAFDSRLGDWLQIKGNFEFRQYFNMFSYLYLDNKQFSGMQWNEFFVREAYGDLSLFHAGNFSGSLKLGLFPYKYDPEVSNLGEYLFRSGTYPFYLVGEFDRPFADLTGFCAGFSWRGSNDISAHLDILGLTEQEMRPYWAFSLAAIADVNLYKIVDLGAGIDYANIPADANPETQTDSTATQYITSNGDTGNYSFTCVKVMARVTIDPFGRIRREKGPLADFLGKEGGKIYGEGAIIGLKNYPDSITVNNLLGYDKVSQRMPFVVGVKIPAWKILDQLSLEAEHYPNPYPNDYQQVIVDGLPLPSIGGEDPYFSALDYSMPHWYWSLNMEKDFTRHISVIIQASRDHTRWEFYPTENLNYDFEEVERGHGDWGWNGKVVFSF